MESVRHEPPLMTPAIRAACFNDPTTPRRKPWCGSRSVRAVFTPSIAIETAKLGTQQRREHDPGEIRRHHWGGRLIRAPCFRDVRADRGNEQHDVEDREVRLFRDEEELAPRTVEDQLRG